MSLEASATLAAEAAVAARAAARLARVLEVMLADLDLSLPQYRLLAWLSRGEAAATALADSLRVTRPSVTSLVDGLVERGLVERHPDDEDRRRVAHVLTTEGKRVLRAADSAVEKGLRRVAERLPVGEAERAFRCLELWYRALEATRTELAVRDHEKQPGNGARK